jgi:hypothetical protein
MLIPGLADVLYSLNERFADFGLGGELLDGHVGNVCSNANNVVQGGHDRIDGIIDENAGGSAIICGRIAVL